MRVVLLLLVLLVFSHIAYAEQLSVKKVVLNKDIKTGDYVRIALEFHNPFNTSLPITIKDSNILGNNGIEIQCYEYTLPPHNTTLSYNEIQAFSAGEFTLDSATITYKNPVTGKQETITTKPIKIKIRQGKAQVLKQGITTIYNCNGVSMQTTSYSASYSSSITISSGQINPFQQGYQNMQNIKKEINRQEQSYQKMQNELSKRIENNSEFKKMRKELEEQGYSLVNKSITDTGNFEYNFRKGNKIASIKGRMRNGRMEYVYKYPEDLKNIKKLIESNETFLSLHNKLLKKGYNLTEKNINLASNISFEYIYNNHGRKASITGKVINDKVRDVALHEEKSFPYWMLIFLVIIGIYLYKKYGSNGSIKEHAQEVISVFDPKEEALAKLEKAVQIFNIDKKEAYSKVSEAVRWYLKKTLGIPELTSEEIIERLSSKDVTYAKECFMLCDRVKFAKYDPNLEDFRKAVECARRIIENGQ